MTQDPNLLRLLFLIANLVFSINAEAQIKCSITSNEKCSEVEDYFYFEVGWIKNKKFHHADVRSPTAFVFYRQVEKNKFNTDTAYFVLEKNDLILKTLNNLQLKFYSFESRISFMDSIYKQNCSENNLIKIPYKTQSSKKGDFIVFGKVKLKFQYSETFDYCEAVSNKYIFSNNSTLRAASNQSIFYKPIIRFIK